MICHHGSCTPKIRKKCWQGTNAYGAVTERSSMWEEEGWSKSEQCRRWQHKRAWTNVPYTAPALGNIFPDKPKILGVAVMASRILVFAWAASKASGRWLESRARFAGRTSGGGWVGDKINSCTWSFKSCHIF